MDTNRVVIGEKQITVRIWASKALTLHGRVLGRVTHNHGVVK